MTTEETQEPKEATHQDKLDEFTQVLKRTKNKKRAVGLRIKKTEARLKKAVKEAETASEEDKARKETVARGFAFDLDKLYQEYGDLVGKAAWAKRMVDSVTYEMNTRPTIKRDFDGELVAEEELIQRPFAALAKMRVA